MDDRYSFNFPSGLAKCHIYRKLFLDDNDVKGLETVLVLVDESHGRSEIRKCSDCGQMFFYNFVEEIDWKDGKDRQFRTFLPIDGKVEVEELLELSFKHLRQISPRIEWDFLDKK